MKSSSEQAAIIAEAIEITLAAYLRGDLSSVRFHYEVVERDPTMNEPKKLANSNLVAVWNFADTFSDAAKHDFDDVDGISWTESVSLLQDAAQRLKEGQPILDPRILGYAKFV